MSKDAKGHGSEGRGGSSFDNINAQRKAQGFQPMPEKNRGMHDFFDYMAGSGPKPDFMNAASAVVGSGPKSAPVDMHPAMASVAPSANHPGLGERGGNVNARYDRENPGPYEGPRKGRWPKDVMKD